MVIQPYLAYTGDCEASLNFYKSVLGGDITFIMRRGESPIKDQVPVELHQKVMHATFTVDGTAFIACDRPPGIPGPTGFCGITLSITGKDLTASETIHKNLAAGDQSPCLLARRFGQKASECWST